MIKDYQGLYSIGLEIDGTEIGLEPTAFSFSMIDTIFSLYSRGVLEFYDSSGLLNEALLFTPGHPVKLQLGLKNSVLEVPYVIEKGPQNEFLGNDNPGAMVRLNLIHEWKYKQRKKSKSFSSRISDIVRSSIAASYAFKELLINDTGNNSKWYQPLLTDAKFLMDILLPNAWSSNADNSPFFAFVDSRNRFHFQNVKQMMGVRGNAKFTYVFRPHSDVTKRYDTILQMRQISEKDFLTRATFYQFDPESGVVEKEEKALADLQSGTGYAPFRNSLDQDTQFKNLFWKKGDKEAENRKGLIVNAFRNSFFIDKLFILVPFNPEITSGMSINIEVPLTRTSDENFSQRFTGEYLTLMTEHVWLSKEKMAFTKLLLGRRDTAIMSDVAAKVDLYGGV